MTRSALLFCVLCLAAACRPAPTVVNAPAHGEAMRGVTVVGFGEAKGMPDIARVSIGVEARAATVEAATQEAQAKMSAIIATLGQQGIAKRDMRTQNYSVNFEKVPEPPRPLSGVEAAPGPGAKPRVGKPAVEPQTRFPEGVYRVSNVLDVTARNLDKLGEVLSSATRAGANQIWGVRFEVDDPSALENQARQQAVAKAKARAQSLAQLAGVRLGPIISITEEGMQPGPVFAPRAMEASAESVPIERGEITITQRVQIVYSLPEAPP